MRNRFPQSFWEDLYSSELAKWDLGSVSPALKHNFDRLENRHLRILIPGCGTGYEAEYLHKKRFTNIHVLDISRAAITRFKQRVPDFPESRIHLADFFTHRDSYDMVIEHTFFCALDPVLRPDYIRHMVRILKEGGELTGLLFDFPLIENGPPFGGDANLYKELFGTYFEIQYMRRATQSAPGREGKELLFSVLREPDQTFTSKEEVFTDMTQ